MNLPFKVGIITDEITQDFFEAGAFAVRYGLDCVELRSVNDRTAFELLERDINRIKSTIKKYKLEVCAISAPLYKCDFNNDMEINAHIKNFEKCAAHANEIGAKFIRGFDFWESGVSLKRRVEKFKKIAEICEKYNVICVLESEPTVHSNTPHKLAELLRAIDSPYIKALFDPGNEVFVTGKPSEDAYEVLKPYIAHIHIKDVAVINGKAEAVKVGTGLIDYKTLFKKLIADGFNGSVVLETHYRKNTHLTEEQLRRPGGSAFSIDAYDASEESVIELQKIINEAIKTNRK